MGERMLFATDSRDRYVDYESDYRVMRAAGIRIEGEPLRRLIAKCRENAWLKVGGVDFEPEGFCPEGDYDYCLTRYDDIAMLEAFFRHGNWAIRQGVQYRDLIFVQQVNGGDEWWTLKAADGRLVAFESISFRHMIGRGEFRDFVGRLAAATVEQCRRLEY